MSDKEFEETLHICFTMVIAFLLFPALCLIMILFGYVWTGFIVMECVVGCLTIICFIFRTAFLLRYYPKYTTKKRLMFETIAYVACLVFAFATAFLVKDDNGVFTYYFLNIYVQPLYMVFVFVVMGFHIATGKKVAKAYNAEKKSRASNGRA